MNVCVADAQCGALLLCAEACEDVDCVVGCYGLYPQGATLADQVRDCLGNFCVADCPWGVLSPDAGG
jgi:hypothetical protein